MPTSTSSAPITSTTASVALPPDALAVGPAAGGTAGDGAGGDTWADATPVMSPSSTRTDAAKNSLVLSIVGHPLRAGSQQWQCQHLPPPGGKNYHRARQEYTGVRGRRA